MSPPTSTTVKPTAANTSEKAAEPWGDEKDFYSASADGPTTSGADGENGIQLNAAAAKWPDYANRIERLDTYKTWPKPKIDVNALVEAGMFYKGDEDRTECYYCGIPLKLWDIHDEPWIEHARFSQDCQFLHFHKGWAFVKAVLEFYDLSTVGIQIQRATYSVPLPRPTCKNTQAKSFGIGSSSTPASKPKGAHVVRTAEPSHINARLDRDNAKKRVEGGDPRELVRGVIPEPRDDLDSFSDLASDVRNAAESTGVPMHKCAPRSRPTPGSALDKPGPHRTASACRPGPYRHARRNKMPKKNIVNDQNSSCKHCKKKEANFVFKCGHTVLCNSCAKVASTCPKCHKVTL